MYLISGLANWKVFSYSRIASERYLSVKYANAGQDESPRFFEYLEPIQSLLSHRSIRTSDHQNLGRSEPVRSCRPYHFFHPSCSVSAFLIVFNPDAVRYRRQLDVGSGSAIEITRAMVGSTGVQIYILRRKKMQTVYLHRLAAVARLSRDIQGQASHLCGQRACFNPVHIVDESASQNCSRKGCQGLSICQRGHVSEHSCTHDPQCEKPKTARPRCRCPVARRIPAGISPVLEYRWVTKDMIRAKVKEQTAGRGSKRSGPTTGKRKRIEDEVEHDDINSEAATSEPVCSGSHSCPADWERSCPRVVIKEVRSVSHSCPVDCKGFCPRVIIKRARS